MSDRQTRPSGVPTGPPPSSPSIRPPARPLNRRAHFPLRACAGAGLLLVALTANTPAAAAAHHPSIRVTSSTEMTRSYTDFSRAFAVTATRTGGLWYFSDPARGINNEILVGAASTMIDAMARARGIAPLDGTTLTLFFSDVSFPGSQVAGTLVTNFPPGQSPPLSGSDYLVNGTTVWLCPVLLKYFAQPPPTLWAGVA